MLRRCLKGEYEPLISTALFHECEDVVNRKRIKDICPLSGREVRELMNAYYSTCKWLQIYYLWRPNLKDENDNFLVELAVVGNCELIVTNNVKDFEGTELNFSDLKIVKPEQLLRGN